MNKRNLASFLWFLVGWQAGGFLVSFTDLPVLLGFAPGVALAVLVRWDPTRVFSRKPEPIRKLTPINDYAAALDRHLDKRVEQWPVVETDRTSV